MTPPARDGDGGQVLLLILGYVVVLLVLVTVLASATAVHLARSRLVDLADATALAAAGTLDTAAYYDPATGGAAGGGDDLAGVVPLSDAGVRSAATDYLGAVPLPTTLRELALAAPTGAPDGRTAEVTLTAVVVPPLLGPVLQAFSGGITLTATGRARGTDPSG